MKLLNKATNIFDRTINLLALLAVILIASLMLTVSAQVIVRYLLNFTTLGLNEINEYSLLWITFLGSAWLLKEEGHVKMDIVLTRFKPRAQAIINFITSIIGAIICLLLARYSAEVTWELLQTDYFMVTSVLKTPAWPIMGIIPIGTFLLFIQFARRSYGYLRTWRTLPSERPLGL